MEIQNENSKVNAGNEKKGYVPETTDEILEDLTPTPEKTDSSLLNFLKSRTIKLAPLALLGAAVFGGAKVYENSQNGSSGQETAEITMQDQKLIEGFQQGEGMILKDLAKSPEAFMNTYKKGEVIGRDEHGKPVETGYVDVKNYPADKFPNGAPVEVIAKLPVGTKIENLAIISPQDKKDASVGDNYISFSCESVKGEFHDAKEVEKVIDLGNGTVCVVPWVNIYGQAR